MNSEGALAGRVALVTGGSKGIGLAIARRLGHMGARVSICARSQANLEEAASGLRAARIEVLASTDRVAHEVVALVTQAP